jgi:NAD(P)-dependent dehydrogenase (short-subunit alcohol dehydrogenase family)
MINSLIQCTALELASFGVRVNGVAPGITHTSFRVGVNPEFKESNNNQLMEMIGKNNLLLSKPIYPENVVDSIMFLASDEAAFMTGEILQVDDGFGLNHDFNFNAEI